MSNLSLSLLLLLTTLSAAVSAGETLLAKNNTSPCPLNFEILRRLGNEKRQALDVYTQCQYIRQGLRLVQSEYLKSTGKFLPPIDKAEACWDEYQTLVNQFIKNFDIRKSCGFETSWISEGCMNITTRAQFVSTVTRSTVAAVVAACNQSLENSSPCASCTTSLSSLQAEYLTGNSVGNVSDCTAYPSIYAAAFANQLGPTDTGTSKCLFSLDFTKLDSNKSNKVVIACVVIGCGFVLVLGVAGILFFRRKIEKMRKRRRIVRRESSLASGLESISGSTTLIKYTFEEIKQSTKSFSRDNIIGRGGYGNVYKGVLKDGSEVALKRFKNCSVSGDEVFAHEVEVIASVRHVNLVALRGYCTATTPYEGHQRIIVCDLMKNGSLHDHLHDAAAGKKLTWPTRQKIALGTARGLAYLHYGAQPGIIHRDIKANNILLDEKFEPKVADFGLAKFTPEGMTHLSTRVAGTMGYVAPEYALYGQLTERSDVYSFGVVFLELLSGKKALMAANHGQPDLVTDWAWSLVRKGRPLDVIEDGMPDMGPRDIMEKYVLIAVLCSHPQLYARPSMDQVVKMLDMDIAIPSIPDRPMSIIANRQDIERSVSSSSSGHLSSPTGYQTYTPRSNGVATRLKQKEEDKEEVRVADENLQDTT